MSAGERLRVALAGLAAGIAGGLFGVGGGLVLVPILTGAFALTHHQAHGTSLAAIGATAIAAVVVYALGGHVAWTTAALLAMTSVLTARLGARAAARTSRETLARAFAIFLVVVAARLLWKPPESAGHALLGGAVGVAAILATGAAAGFLAGFMGVGGGIVVVPALTILFATGQQTAQGTSLAVILVTAPFGALEHHRHGNVVPRLVPWLAIGAALGAPLGSRAALALPAALLTRTFAVFLLVNAALLWRRASRRPASA